MGLLQRTTILMVGGIAAISAAACGGQAINAQTSCRDFLKAAPQEQDAAVSSLAADFHAANAVTPLGRPNINYLCANQPQMTLGEAVKRTG